MPTDEFVRWCAFLKMRLEPTEGSGSSPVGGKIAKFRAKLNKMGFYKHIGYRR